MAHSFARLKWSDGDTTLAQWMNGDCMGQIPSVPKRFKEVRVEHAEELTRTRTAGQIA
jgi:hypothetical protein